MAGNQFPIAGNYGNLPNGLFSPDIWSMRFLRRYYEDALTPQLVNLDYEGEIKKFGDMVRIRREPEATVEDYQKGAALKTQVIEDEEVQFPIAKGNYYNLAVDDVEEKQSDVEWVTAFTRNAVKQLSRKIDEVFLGNVYSDAAAANIMANRVVTPNNIPELLVDAAVLLDEAHVPEENRWIVVPYWFKGHLKLNPTFVSAEKMGDSESIIRTGKVGRFDRFEVYCSPKLAVSASHTQIVFGNRTAVTFATQFMNHERIRSENTFGEKLRGLQVWDYKTVQTTHLGKVGVQKG